MCHLKLSILVIAFLHSNLFAGNLHCKNKDEFLTGKSMAEIVAASSSISMATVVDFLSDNSKPPFKGYYKLSTDGEIKGPLWQGHIKIWGDEPYARIPQYYIDLTARHKDINLNQVYSGLTGFALLENGNCILYPRFMVGYRYLVLVDVKHSIAYEPIHSTNIDKWYQSVYEESLKYVRFSNEKKL